MTDDRLQALRGEQVQLPVPKPKGKFFKRFNKQYEQEVSRTLTREEVERLSETSDIPIVMNGTVREKKKHEKLGFWNKRRLKKSPEKAFFIEMFFSNGTSKEFVITTNDEIFRYNKRWYHLRFENSWFNLSQNQYKLNFFDDYCEPMDREVIRKLGKDGDKNFFSVTPDNLKPLIDMEYVKALASSQELDKYLKMVAVFGFINLFISFIIIWKSFQAVKFIRILAGV